MVMPQTSVTNHDGSVTWTTTDAAGHVLATTTVVTNQDGSRTETRKDASGKTTAVFNKNPAGQVVSQLSPNADGTTNYTQFGPDGTEKTTVIGTDGKTPVATETRATDGSKTTTYLNPDGTPKQPPVTLTQEQQSAAANAAYEAEQKRLREDPNNPQLSKNQGGSGNLLFNPGAALDEGKGAAKNIKSWLDSTNPVGTPGLNNTVVTDKIFGDKNDGSVFSDDSAGGLLKMIADFYGLGGLGGKGGTGGDGTVGGVGAGGIDTSAISQAAAASKAMQDKFLADYNAAHPNQPPVMSAAQLPPAVLATMPEAIRPGHADATLLDPTMQGQQRDKQVDLERQIQDAIYGIGPSVAQLQQERALQTNSANQLGLASRASGGGNVALALRTAANNIGRLNQGAASDAALLRAKEIADARAQLGGVVDQTRTGDIALADKNAGLATHVSETNAGLDSAAALKKAELDNLTRIANSKAQNDTNLKQGELTTTAGANNLTSALEQQRIDAAARDAAAKNALAAGGQVITGTVGAADAQARAAAAALAAKQAADAKQAAGFGALSTTIASLISGSKKSGSNTDYGNGPTQSFY